MQHARPHMLGLATGVSFPPTGSTGGNLSNINGIGAMGGMGSLGNVAGMGGMNGLGGMSGVGGGGPGPTAGAGAPGAGGGAGGAAGLSVPGPGQLQQQHPGQHQTQHPPMGILQNHQPQPHVANPPPMGGLQPGGNQPGQNPGPSGIQPQLGQQPNGFQFSREQVMRQMEQQRRLQQAQHQGGQPGQQPGQPQLLHQQGISQQQQQQQSQQPPQPGGFPTGMSNMGMFGSPRPPNLMNTGNANGMGPMAGLGGMGGMGAGGFQGINPGGAAGAMGQLAIRRVPSQAGQPNQPQPPGGGGGNPMAMMNAMNMGRMNPGMNMPSALNALRQGMPGGQQVMQPFPGAQPPGPAQLAPGQTRSVSNMGDNIPPDIAQLISQQQQERRQQQQAQGQQQQPQQQPGQHGTHPQRTPSVVNAVPPGMPPNVGVGMNGSNNSGGPMSGAMGGPGMTRTSSAQSMGPPALAPGGMHPGLPNHANPSLSQQISHGQQQNNPPPFTNPLHHTMQNPSIQHQHHHQQLGGASQQHHLGGQPGHQQPGVMSGGPPMGVMPGAGHVGNANALPGGMQGHPGQQHAPNAGSPQRPGTSGHSQPQTPSMPVSAASVRPQSRADGQQPMMGFPGGAGQPQFGGQMRQPNGGPPHQHQLGQPGPLGPPFGNSGLTMAGRVTPQHTQSPMAALGSSPGGPGPGQRPGQMGARPGSSSGPVAGGMGGVNMNMPAGLSTPSLTALGARPGLGPPGGDQSAFPTPAQQLAEQHAARPNTMSAYGSAVPPMTAVPHPSNISNMGAPGLGQGQGQGPGQGVGLIGPPQRPPTVQAHGPGQGGPGPGPGQQGHGSGPGQMPPFVNPVHPGQRPGSAATHRQPTPALQQAGGPLGRTGTPNLAQSLPQGALNQSPTRPRPPSRQQHAQVGGPGPGQGQPQGTPAGVMQQNMHQYPLHAQAKPANGPTPPGPQQPPQAQGFGGPQANAMLPHVPPFPEKAKFMENLQRMRGMDTTAINEGRPVDLYQLHCEVMNRGGADAVSSL